MTTFPWTDLLIILALIAANGVFAMSEMAIVSSRETRLQAMVNRGTRGAETALGLHREPGPFLSTVQIGITLVGIVNGAYSGATLAEPVGLVLVDAGVSPDLAGNIGLVLVVTLITYLTLTVGELVPKQIALQSPEKLAALIAAPMSVLAKIAAPFVWLLDKTTGLLLRLAGQGGETEQRVTAEELHLLVAEAQRSGAIEETERLMISGVMRLADRPVRGVMTPRTEIDWLDANAPPEAVRAHLAESPHTRIPVADGTVDRIVGVLQARDVLSALLNDDPLDLSVLVRSAPLIPDVMDASDALDILRKSDIPMGLVHDEYGHFEGVLTPSDLLSAIAGVFQSDIDEGASEPAVERPDGSWLLSGAMHADEMADRLGISIPDPDDRDFETVAGFALAVLTHIPHVGETFEFDGCQFEIVDLDGHKIDKVLAIPQDEEEKE
ncbi:DNA-binding protein [Pacificimonas flava]|uniref:DNA-binding protein n=2 Tax=Pacificimonas TaxID=1960290 RepID=A0A219B566_9SPHN|nr:MULTISPECIES: hemolysin family protein [Pacificimonas]MBZ6379509.1 HlyC/CorC family transporter [Pacificimonas aurantium]OWV33303.1 DNA-binding protein [Pacificimonas flava]